MAHTTPQENIANKQVMGRTYDGLPGSLMVTVFNNTVHL